jgi:Ca2+-transporting ATPase
MTRNGSFTVETALDTFMFAVAVAARIPGGLAAVVTIVLSIGVTNMSRRNAVIRKLTAVETLGLRARSSARTRPHAHAKPHDRRPSTFRRRRGACSPAAPWRMRERRTGRGWQGHRREHRMARWWSTPRALSLKKGDLDAEAPRVGESAVRFHAQDDVHRAQNGRRFHAIHQGPRRRSTQKNARSRSKTARPSRSPSKRPRAILAENKRMADKALRVLAAATRAYAQMPALLRAGWIWKRNSPYYGLTGMIDPVRPESESRRGEIRAAASVCCDDHGDHVDTAAAIALELGIISSPSEPSPRAAGPDLR